MCDQNYKICKHWWRLGGHARGQLVASASPEHRQPMASAWRPRGSAWAPKIRAEYENPGTPVGAHSTLSRYDSSNTRFYIQIQYYWHKKYSALSSLKSPVLCNDRADDALVTAWPQLDRGPTSACGCAGHILIADWLPMVASRVQNFGGQAG